MAFARKNSKGELEIPGTAFMHREIDRLVMNSPSLKGAPTRAAAPAPRGGPVAPARPTSRTPGSSPAQPIAPPRPQAR